MMWLCCIRMFAVSAIPRVVFARIWKPEQRHVDGAAKIAPIPLCD
jgi:hypothetical protein